MLFQCSPLFIKPTLKAERNHDKHHSAQTVLRKPLLHCSGSAGYPGRRPQIRLWLVCDRLLHNPVENAVRVEGGIILLEGNYLLLDEDGWHDLADFADYIISITADEAFLRARLIVRKMKTGVDTVRFVYFSQMPNVRICLTKSRTADLQLIADKDGEYHLSG